MLTLRVLLLPILSRADCCVKSLPNDLAPITRQSVYLLDKCGCVHSRGIVQLKARSLECSTSRCQNRRVPAGIEDADRSGSQI